MANSGSGRRVVRVLVGRLQQQRARDRSCVLPPEGLCQFTSAKANPACSGAAGRGFGCEPLNGFFTKSLRSLKSYWLPKNIRIGSRLLWQP